MEHLISIIIPVYKGNPVYFNKTIDSCLNQSYKNVEVIIINNGFNDEIQDKLDELDKLENIHVIKNSKQGVSSGRNLGIQNASGDYIMFLDADDWIENNACEVLLKQALELNADCVISNYSRDYSDHKEEMIHFTEDRVYSNWKEYLKDLLNVQAGVGFCWGKLIKAETIKNVFLNENLCLAEDAEYCARACQNWKVIAGNKNALVHYVFNEQSAVRKFDTAYADKFLLSMNAVEEDLKDIINQDKNLETLFYNFVSYHVLLILVNYCAHPQNKDHAMKSLNELMKNSLFKRAVKNSNYDGISITRKVPLWFLKHKMNRFALLVGQVRQKQFSKSK